ncbi:hypothetical protein C8255_24605, partial [filamentous cyanobacterium CCP3]
MAQYDDRNPFSAASGRPQPDSPWADPTPDPEVGRGGLHLPGEADGAWGGDRLPRPTPEARRRNQWRQHQQLTPDFGGAAPEPEPTPRPSARNASLPTFRRGPANREPSLAPQPSARPDGLGRQRPTTPPPQPQLRSPQPQLRS